MLVSSVRSIGLPSRDASVFGVEARDPFGNIRFASLGEHLGARGDVQGWGKNSLSLVSLLTALSYSPSLTGVP